MKLSTLAILLGLGFGLPQIFGLLRPARFRDAVRNFPRSESPGYVLMLLGTAWFLINLKNEHISDFDAYKPHMLTGFGLVGILTCVFVRDFLAVRGFALVIMLLAKLMLDTARWVDTDWRLIVTIWAYALVVAGMWFTVSPWRMRDVLNWGTATDRRIQFGSALRLAFGLFVAILGLTVYRTAEVNAGPESHLKPAIHLARTPTSSGP